MNDPTMTELRRRAKEQGINSFGKTKAALMAALETPETRGPRPATREETGRRARVPLGTQRLKLTYPARDGYHRHWINDRANRIHDAEMAGYSFVEELKDGRQQKVSCRVGTHEDGSPMSAYLMEIRQEFYTEDQAAKQQAVDEIDAAILQRDQPNDADAREPGRYYTPSEGTSIRVET